MSAEKAEVKAVEKTEKSWEEMTPQEQKAKQAIDLMQSNIGSLSLADQAKYLAAMAQALGLNPALKPFDIIKGDGGKLIVYANAGCADQMRDIRKLQSVVKYRGSLRLGDKVDPSQFEEEVEVQEFHPQMTDLITEVVKAAAEGKLPGDVACNLLEQIRKPVRSTADLSVSFVGEAARGGLSTLIMKNHTKAERRATLGHCGVGFPDASELADIPTVNVLSGPREVQPSPRALPAAPQPIVAPEVTQSPTAAVPVVMPAPKPPMPPPVAAKPVVVKPR